MKKTVVLYPGLDVGHLTSMVALADVFLQHGVDVTVVLIEQPVQSPDFSAAIARAAASNPSVTFHVLPPPPSPVDAGSSRDDAPKHRLLQMFDLCEAMNSALREFLRSLPSIHALLIDMFCIDALDIAAELKLPVYSFYPSGAGDLAVFLRLPSLRASMNKGFGELGDSLLSLPGAPPFKASDLPEEAVKDSDAAKAAFRIFERMPEANGILINTFESLETRAVRALRDGLCVPSRATPPVYCMRPLVTVGGEKDHECLRWLDTQPDDSVVFLSFGSMGTFPKKQLEEIATGLEKSGQRFLWVVQSSRSPDHKFGEPLPQPVLNTLLPDGFLERTKGKGLVVKSWVPQVDVLRHRATGAFVTHCEWNLTLEGITAGLPLLCWPLYLEQRMNKVFIVEEMKLGVEMRGYNEKVVMADEVEEKVRWVMESEGGQALRERVVAAKDRATEALKEGGSSHAAFVQFLEDLETITRS